MRKTSWIGIFVAGLAGVVLVIVATLSGQHEDGSKAPGAPVPQPVVPAVSDTVTQELPASKELVNHEQVRANREVDLTPPRPEARCQFHLIVRDGNGASVPRATVEVMQPRRASQECDVRGECEITLVGDACQGDAIVQVRAEGYLTSPGITLSGPHDSASILITLHEVTVVQGTMHWAWGDPVVGGSVWLRPVNPCDASDPGVPVLPHVPQAICVTSTDSAGAFQSAPVCRECTYVASGFATGVRCAHVADVPVSLDEVVSLIADIQREDPGDFRIQGTVVDAHTGSPAAGASVGAREYYQGIPQLAGEVQSVMTAKDGSFTITDARSGHTYEVAAKSHEGQQGITGPVMAGTRGVLVGVASACNVEVVVRDKFSQAPQAGVAVTCWAVGPSHSRWVFDPLALGVTDANGVVTLKDIGTTPAWLIAARPDGAGGVLRLPMGGACDASRVPRSYSIELDDCTGKVAFMLTSAVSTELDVESMVWKLDGPGGLGSGESTRRRLRIMPGTLVDLGVMPCGYYWVGVSSDGFEDAVQLVVVGGDARTVVALPLVAKEGL